MLEMLENALVKSTTSLVVLPVILIIVMIAVVLFLERITRAAEEVNEKEPWKYWRYDAANPSKDRDVRKKVSMQYLGYLIIFLAVEPAAILLALLSTASRETLPSLLKLFGVFVAAYTPLLIYAVNESRKVDSWKLD